MNLMYRVSIFLGHCMAFLETLTRNKQERNATKVTAKRLKRTMMTITVTPKTHKTPLTEMQNNYIKTHIEHRYTTKRKKTYT